MSGFKDSENALNDHSGDFFTGLERTSCKPLALCNNISKTAEPTLFFLFENHSSDDAIWAKC